MMQDPQGLQQVENPTAEAILRLPAASLPALEQLADKGYFVARVDRAPVFDKPTLLHALYQSCAMPAYFGFNWDALYDMLTDFSWKPARGYVLVFRDFGLLQQRAPQEAQTFLQIVREASQARQADQAPPLKLVLLEA